MSTGGFFGNLFDFNGDGKLDSFERAADFSTFMGVTQQEDEDKTDDDDDTVKRN